MNKFKVAFKGLITAVKDKSVAIQFVLGILAIVAGVIFGFSIEEFLIVGLCIGLVITTEILNTCIERLCDVVCSEYDERIGKIKDMAAGAVLWASIVSLVIGVILIMKHIF
ncbi:MAG: diacylglycerol kinase family protein [Erysipelotrichaceae bacterium]|nr:diacylglycerol kinase family protein [Erysipelotrichaceae bacterium]